MRLHRGSLAAQVRGRPIPTTSIYPLISYLLSVNRTDTTNNGRSGRGHSGEVSPLTFFAIQLG